MHYVLQEPDNHELYLLTRLNLAFLCEQRSLHLYNYVTCQRGNNALRWTAAAEDKMLLHIGALITAALTQCLVLREAVSPSCCTEELPVLNNLDARSYTTRQEKSFEISWLNQITIMGLN